MSNKRSYRDSVLIESEMVFYFICTDCGDKNHVDEDEEFASCKKCFKDFKIETEKINNEIEEDEDEILSDNHNDDDE